MLARSTNRDFFLSIATTLSLIGRRFPSKKVSRIENSAYFIRKSMSLVLTCFHISLNSDFQKNYGSRVQKSPDDAANSLRRPSLNTILKLFCQKDTRDALFPQKCKILKTCLFKSYRKKNKNVLLFFPCVGSARSVSFSTSFSFFPLGSFFSFCLTIGLLEQFRSSCSSWLFEVWVCELSISEWLALEPAGSRRFFLDSSNVSSGPGNRSEESSHSWVLHLLRSSDCSADAQTGPRYSVRREDPAVCKYFESTGRPSTSPSTPPLPTVLLLSQLFQLSSSPSSSDSFSKECSLQTLNLAPFNVGQR